MGLSSSRASAFASGAPAGAPAALPGPKGRWLGGSSRAYRQAPLVFLRKLREECGDLVRFRLGRTPHVLLAHPHEIARVLREPESPLRKGRSGHRVPLSESALASWPSAQSGCPHRNPVLRSLLTPRTLDGLADGWASASEDVADAWESEVKPSETIDVFGEMLSHAVDMSLQSFLSVGAGTVEGDLLSQTLAICFDQFRHDVKHDLTRPGEALRIRGRELRAALDQLSVLLERKLAERLAAPGGPGDDFLGQFITAHTQVAQPPRATELEAEVRALFMPGAEAIGSALGWTLWLLAAHPAFQEEMAKEVSRVFGDARVDYEGMGSLYLTRMVIDESLRLYPPTWWIERIAREELDIAGFRIPRGTRLVVSPWVTHRHPEVWEDPDSFDPLRFSPARSTGRLPLSHLPFGAGARACPAEPFVRNQLAVALATLVRRFRLIPEEGQALTPVASLALEPSEPAWIRLETRTRAAATS